MMEFIKKLIPLSIFLYLIIPIQYSVQSPIQEPSLLRKSSGNADSDTTEKVTGDENDDYPSDTHGGAVRAFGQLVSADDSAMSISSRSFANSNGLNTEDGKGDIGASGAEYGLANNGKVEEGNEDEDTSENNSKQDGLDDDPQYYPLEEFYLYTYDDAGDDDNDDDEGGRMRNNDFDDQDE